MSALPPKTAVAVSRMRALAQHLLVPESTSARIMNRRIVVRKIPDGEPKASDFEMVSEPLPAIADGEMLLKTKWLTLDPYMRGLRPGEGMTNPKALGMTMMGGTVSEVVESRAAGWQPGDLAVGYYGWQEYAVAKPSDVQWQHPKWPIEKWDASLGSASAALGVLGMTGYTSYFGLFDVGKPKAGETLVVSAASGAVGAVVGQLGKQKGCRVVGIAGGAKKCGYCVDELGFDACVDYKAADFPALLKAAAPQGIDVYFENVGGDVLEAVIPLLNKGCRVPVCGFVSQYNSTDQHPKTPLQRLKDVGLPEMNKRNLAGDGFRFFTFAEFVPRFPEALQELSQAIKDGKLKYRESVTEGLENAVEAFVGMLRGENFGKTLIKVT